MKIGKAALLESIDAALELHEEKTVAYAQAVERWQVARRQQWLEEKAPQWRGVRDVLTQRLKRGEPVTRSDLEPLRNTRSGYRADYFSEHVFIPDQSPPNPVKVGGREFYQSTVPVGDLVALRDVLVAAEDEVFSLEGLARLGFKAPAWVFRAAVGK